MSELSGLIKYNLTAKPIQYQADGAPYGWHFISFPKDVAKTIWENHKWQEKGWLGKARPWKTEK